MDDEIKKIKFFKIVFLGFSGLFGHRKPCILIKWISVAPFVTIYLISMAPQRPPGPENGKWSWLEPTSSFSYALHNPGLPPTLKSQRNDYCQVPKLNIIEQTDILVSMETGKTVFNQLVLNNWGENSQYTYVLLPENLDPAQVIFFRKNLFYV